MTVRLNLVVLRTTDMTAAIKFYSQLEINFVEEQHGKGPKHFSGKLGDVVLEIYPASKEKGANSDTRLGFRVMALDSLLEKLRATGVPIEEQASETPWGYRAVIRDPDGRAVELTQA